MYVLNQAVCASAARAAAFLLLCCAQARAAGGAWLKSPWVEGPQLSGPIVAQEKPGARKSKAGGLIAGDFFDIPGPREGGPPDLSIAAGPGVLLCVVGPKWGVYTLSGECLFESSLSDWFAAFEPPGRVAEAQVLFDREAGRWLLCAVSSDPDSAFSAYLISVSDDADPMGVWWGWLLDAGYNGTEEDFTTARDLRFGPAGDRFLVISSDQYAAGGDFLYARLRLLHRAQLYWEGEGSALSWRDFWALLNKVGAPANHFRPVEEPQGGSSGYLVSSWVDAESGSFTLWRFAGDTLSLVKEFYGSQLGPEPVAQPGTDVVLYASEPPLGNAVFKDGHLVIVHEAGYGTEEEKQAAVGVIDYQPDRGLLRAFLYTDRWNAFFSPSLTLSSTGHVVLACNVSSSDTPLRTNVTRDSLSILRFGPIVPVVQGEGAVETPRIEGGVRWRRGCALSVGAGPCKGEVWVAGAFASGNPPWSVRVRRVLLQECFVRGDSSLDGAVDLADAVAILGYLFTGPFENPCPKTMDNNDDGRINIADAVFLLGYLFGGGEQPAPPFPSCGPDPTPGGFIPLCASYPPCLSEAE